MSAVLSILLATAATGAPATSSCGDQPTQTGMTMCFGQAAERADADMNTVWKQIQSAMQRLDREADPADPREPGFAQALLTSQRAWLAFRDAECRIESYEHRGGSMQPATENQCMADVTKARTKQLRALLWRE